MENVPFSLSDINYLLFIIPGFVVIWTYRFFGKPKPIGEFEYAGLSFIWGVLLVASTSWLLKYFPHPPANDPFGYYFTLWFSTFGFILGWFGSFVAQWKWVKKLVGYLRPGNYGK